MEASDNFSSEKLCRICFDHESSSNPLISPCECNGSMKYVHRECLKKAILVHSNNPKNYSCDICKYKIPMLLSYSYKLSMTCRNSNSFKLTFLGLIILTITSIIGLIINYISNPPSSVSSLAAKTYLLVIMLACLLIDIALIIIFVRAFKCICCTLRIKNWHFYNKETPQAVNLTVLDEKIDCCCNKVEVLKTCNQLFIHPKTPTNNIKNITESLDCPEDH